MPHPFSVSAEPAMLAGTAEIAATMEGRVSGRMLLVDARTPERFRGDAEPIDPVAGHIPGAVNLPLLMNLDAGGRFRSADELRRIHLDVIGAYRPAETVHMCGSGVTACHNLLAMEIAGLHGGRLYAGSWSEWIRDPRRTVATGP